MWQMVAAVPTAQTDYKPIQTKKVAPRLIPIVAPAQDDQSLPGIASHCQLTPSTPFQPYPPLSARKNFEPVSSQNV
jgi:hypothetical protein